MGWWHRLDVRVGDLLLNYKTTDIARVWPPLTEKGCIAVTNCELTWMFQNREKVREVVGPLDGVAVLPWALDLKSSGKLRVSRLPLTASIVVPQFSFEL